MAEIGGGLEEVGNKFCEVGAASIKGNLDYPTNQTKVEHKRNGFL